MNITTFQAYNATLVLSGLTDNEQWKRVPKISLITIILSTCLMKSNTAAGFKTSNYQKILKTGKKNLNFSYLLAAVMKG